MYRQYENPRALEAKLAAKKQEMVDLCDRPLQGGIAAATARADALLSLHEEITDLQERVNFAWQDEEFG